MPGIPRPTMGEMYNDSKHFSIGRFYTNYWVPNPNLRPETNETQGTVLGCVLMT